MKGARILAAALFGGVIALGSNCHAYAWEPKGVIKKYVQNQTTNSARADANDSGEAVSAKPGDIIKYIIEIRNNGSSDNGTENDMYATKMTDSLPTGVELISSPTQRTISEDIGIVPAGQTVSKEYLVRVTSTTDKRIIDNKACFTGDSEPEDNPQEGCDTAKIVISNPPKEEPKTEQPQSEKPTSDVSNNTRETQQKTQPASLPKTGGIAVVPLTLGASIMGYLGHFIYRNGGTRRR